MIALVSIVYADPLEGFPCFQVGYAGAESYRNQGRATEAVRSVCGDAVWFWARRRRDPLRGSRHRSPE